MFVIFANANFEGFYCVRSNRVVDFFFLERRRTFCVVGNMIAVTVNKCKASIAGFLTIFYQVWARPFDTPWGVSAIETRMTNPLTCKALG